jgi:alcohol dehydrogenase
MTLNTTVAPFILRGVNLLGINSATTPPALRRLVWSRRASDMRPRHLAAMTRTIPFVELSGAFAAFIESRVKGRLVVAIG